LQHYNIDPSSSYPYTQLDKKYQSNIKFKRTEYMSLQIEVLDTDAQLAADIANEIALYIDTVIHKMQIDRAFEAFKIVENEYFQVQNEITQLSDSLKEIRQMGVLDYESQAASVNEAYANALSQGKTIAMSNIQNQMQILSKYGGVYVELSTILESEIERMAQIKEKYAAYKVNAEQFIPQIFIVDKAVKSEGKALPKRSMIVIISTLSTFALSLLGLLLFEHIKAGN